MPTTTKQVAVALWHYHCPECGIGDAELGHLAVTDVLYCEVCLEDSRHVRLRRWQAPEEPTQTI